MDLSFTADQDALRQAAERLYAKAATGDRVRELEAEGLDPELWAAVTQMGLPTMALPEEAGGAGASLTDLGVAVEVHGAHLGLAPLVETAVVARLLARLGPTGAELLERIVQGAPAALRLTPTAAVTAYAAVAEVILALDGDAVVALRRPGAVVSTLAGLAAARPDADGAVVLAAGPAAVAAHSAAVEEWRALTAAAQAGLSRATLDLGVAYALERHQFGVPIASFQSIQHRFADLHERVEGSRLLAYQALWALDEGEPSAPAQAAQASWYCGLVAEEAAAFSLHVHGGYGFMLEYDVQLHVRRAKALRLLLGDPGHELQVIAERIWGEAAEDHPVAAARPGREGMDFRFGPATEAFRDEVRAFIAEHLSTEVIDRARATGTMHDWTFHRALCQRGYLASGWPTEFGGLGRDAIDQTLLMQELYGAQAPIDGLNIAAMVGATLLVCGTDEQKAGILPGILAGEVMCCLGYSEPDAGSDVAAVATRAVRATSSDGSDEWVIDGQKMFTTMAHEAAYVFLLTRTAPDKPKHKGLTMFLVPTDTPGFSVTPVHTLGGERTNITWYDGVRVPDRCRVGEVDAGWSVMHAALVYERNSANWGEPDHLVESVARWAREAGRLDDRAVQEVLARWTTELEVGRLLLFRSAWLSAQGGLPHVEGSMAKLHITEAFVRASSDLLDLLGPDGLLPLGEPGTVLHGLVEHAFRHAVVTTIYGGSSEVQREIIAGRGLGLPRNR
jgi:alkylation response protein AidB-like acyl-CoA dehydrogenase